MLLDNSSNGNSNNSTHHKKSLISSLFHLHHHHHHHHSHNHNHSHSSSKSHSMPISLHYSASPPMLDSLSLSDAEDIVAAAEPVVTKWDTNSSSYTKVTSLFQHSRREATEFVQSVKNLRGAMNGLAAASSPKLVLAQQLMQTAMKRLEKELYQMLSDNRDRLDPESISSRGSSISETSSSLGGDDDDDDRELEIANESIAEVQRASALAMSDLKSIAECMIACGYGKECIAIYKTIRKSIIDEGLFRLKIERLRSSQVHKMSPEALAGAAATWINAAGVAAKTLFKGEKALCDHVFASASDTARDACFREIAGEAAENLFRFPAIVAAGHAKKSPPERIFPMMELYETLSDLWPEIEAVFGSEAASDIRSQALDSSLRLRDSIHSALPDIEAAIHKDHSKTLAPGGGIHPMTVSVMDYVSALSDHAGVLSGVLADYPPPPENPMARESLRGCESSDPVAVHVAWIALVLLCKLDGKAELYKDASLSYLFLANNLQYVVERVRTTALSLVLGEDWLSRHDKKVRQYAASYESMAWTKVFFALPGHDHDHHSPAEEAREVFSRFAAAFEEEYRKQAAWVVQDGKLRDELKLSIANKLVPRYREFYDANEAGMDVAALLSPDDLGNYLSDLFHGASTTGISKSFSSSSLSSLSSSSLGSSPRKGLSR